MSVVTVTLNVAIDQTITLEGLTLGHVQRARSVRYNAGGKGVNVASCLADWGTRVFATGILGRENATLFETLFKKKHITDLFIRVDGASRINVKLVDGQETTDINLPGIAADSVSLKAIERILEELDDTAPGVAVLAGSLPGGCPEDIYAAQTEKLTKKGFKVIVDASGPALRKTLAADVLPFCIKPNRNELSEWSGREITDLHEAVRQAQSLHERGIHLVVVSLGEDGALFVSREGSLLARTTVSTIVSTVGAGDAMVAGIAAAIEEGASLERIARLSTAFSATKLGILGPNLPNRDVIEATAHKVEIHPVTNRQS